MLKTVILAVIVLILASILVAQDNGYLTDGKERMRADRPYPDVFSRSQQVLKNTPPPVQYQPDEKTRAAIASPSTQIAAKELSPARIEIINQLQSIQRVAEDENAIKTMSAIQRLINQLERTEKTK